MCDIRVKVLFFTFSRLVIALRDCFTINAMPSKKYCKPENLAIQANKNEPSIILIHECYHIFRVIRIEVVLGYCHNINTIPPKVLAKTFLRVYHSRLFKIFIKFYSSCYQD